ncbi:DUF2812 domain-containing protein [Macrococcoides canis]|uniref:DUF2812 domain-containing protein n=1 Tax=Macrococcoides canis TaxID=1855823 RepID=UPI001B8B4670|nr:DUF2812 domain-containing protein [Macrococcus canis]QUR94336.1 DUF2812 domain-containing protein [Macrococcus canis]
MIKYKAFLDPLKEERWINSVLEQGYRMKNKTWTGAYIFEETDKEYIARIDYQDKFTLKDYEEYKMIYKDFGWQLVSGNKNFNGLHVWQKEKSSDENLNELNSDIASSISYFKRIFYYLLSITSIYELFIFIIYNPENKVFLTPGLWDMEGSLFWKALLFELPFVILRMVPMIILIFMIYTTIVTYNKYKFLEKQ